jgi:hypothetical protein
MLISWLRDSKATLPSPTSGRPTSSMRMPVCRFFQRTVHGLIHRPEATLHSTVADYLQRHHEVDYIEEDLPMFPFGVETQYVYPWTGFLLALKSIFFVRSDAPWHLQRINQDVGFSGTGKKPTDKDYRYTYDSSAGAGVDIYILGKR